MAGGISEAVQFYIENLNIPQEAKEKLIKSNPKTLADVSLWLENHKDVKIEEKPQSSNNPFAAGNSVNSTKDIQLFANNSNIVSSNSNFVFNKGELVDTDDASWGLSIDKSQSSSAANEVSYYSASTAPKQSTIKTSTAAVEQTPEEKRKEAQDNAIASIEENVLSALETVRQQAESQGIVSKAYNSIKEYFGSEMSQSSVCRVLYAEYTMTDLLKRAQNGDLTVAEYFNVKIDTAITLLTGNKELSDEDRKLLKERLSHFTPEQLNQIIDRIKCCDNDEYAQLNDKVDELIEEERTKNYKYNLPDSKSSSISSIMANSELAGGERILTFEEVWEMERGVKFDPQAIKEYEEAAAQYSLVAIVNNRAASVHEALDSALALVNANNTNPSTETARVTAERALESKLIASLKSLYGDDEEQINNQIQKLSNGNMSYKNGQIVYADYIGPNEGIILSTAAEQFLKEIDANVEKIQGEKSLEEYEEQMANAYEYAYGRKNATQLARAFVNDQEEVVGKVRTGVEIAGAGVMVAGMFICPPMAMAGAITSSFGGIGVEALNETTRKEGISEEKKKELIKEVMQNAALFAVGGGAAKMGNAARMALIAKKCPTFMQVAADIGVDSTISLLGDLAITGQISIEGEGLSQLMSLLAGHVRAGKFRKHVTKNNNVPDNQITNNRTSGANTYEPSQKPSANIPVNTKQIAKKLQCSEEKANEIADIINSKPEIKDKLLKIVDSGRSPFDIKELVSMATPENIDDLIKLVKNKSLLFGDDKDGNIVVNNFEEVLNIIKANPQYKTQLMDIASNTNRPISDIRNLAESLQKYPEYADDILSLVKSNRNIKLGQNLRGDNSSNIDDFVNLLKENPDLASEIKQYASVQRKADNDTTNPMKDIKNFVALLKKNPDKKDLYLQLAKNPNLNTGAINLLTDGKLDAQYVNDLVALSAKNYAENGINYNIRLMKKYPELREILLSEPPKFDFIDKDVTNTPQATLEKRFDIKDKIQKIAPDEMKKLQQTLGDNFFFKIKWEDIIPENASPEQIKNILADLNSSSKFFSRVAANEERYGKNIKWAHEMDVISRSASYLISQGASYDTVMNHIAIMYKNYDIATTLDSNIGVSDRRRFSGESREYIPDSDFANATGFSAVTQFNKEDSYNEYYDRFMKLLNKKRQPPYPDVELTQISFVYGYGNLMGHPRNSSVEATMSYVKERYEEMTPLFEKAGRGEALTPQEIALAHDKIAEMYFLMANAMPYSRGSNGIADIFMRSMYKELGIDMPALKPGVSLDLEAFCLDLNDYKKKWRSFFEK